MLGFCPSLLYHIDQIAGENAPGRKMHVAGFLAMLFCCQNSSVTPLNDQFQNGHSRGLTVSYRRRPVESDVQDEDNCDINTQPGKLEWTVPALSHRQYSFHISDDLIRQYCVDASNMMNAGAPPTSVMQEVWDLIIEGANILLRVINKALVTAQATEFGVNTTTSSSTGKVININRNGNDYSLDDGIVEIMSDIQHNEICGTPCIAGGGLFNSFYNHAKVITCCNQAGLNIGEAGIPPFYFDKDTQTIWGENTIGMFAPGSVKFIGRNKYVGSFAGQRGTSFFSTLPLPVNEFGCAEDCLRDLVFDMQIRYNDCPTDDGDGGTLQRGVQVILSKQFALWSQPDNAFSETDELFGTNGMLKYFITNTTYTGGSYAYPA